MSKLWVTLTLVLLLVLPAAARAGHGHGAYVDPNAFGQQTQASINDEGVVTLRRTDTFPVYETQYRTEERVRIVEADGEKREETYTIKVPVIHSKPVHSTFESRVPADKISAFSMAGKPVDADRLKQALKEETTVLVANRKVPGYYLGVYKSDTLLLVVEPQYLWHGHVRGYAMPAPQGGEEGEVVPPPPPPDAAPAPIVDAPRRVAPPPAPAPIAAAPPAKAPAAPADALPHRAPPGMAPRVSLAKITGPTLGLRSYLKDVSSQTVMRKVDVKGVTKEVAVAVETESITDVETRYPQDAVKIVRADGKPLQAGELARLLSSERCVLMSGDGKDVDPSYLKIIRPEALIIVAPIPEPPMPPIFEGPAPVPGVAPPPVGAEAAVPAPSAVLASVRVVP